MEKKELSLGRQIGLLLLLIFSALYVVSSVLFLITRPLFGKADFENLDLFDPVNAYLSAATGMTALFLICFIVYFKLINQDYKKLILFNKWSIKTLGIVLLALVGGIFISQGLYYLNHFIVEQNPASGFLEMEAELSAQQRAWFNPERRELFPLALLVFALLPAFVEELIFRGILLKKLEQYSEGKTHFAVLVSSALFAAFHMQPWNLLPMMGMAVVFGYVYVYTKDIRYSMLMHFLYNGAQITIAFFFAEQAV
jgi:CAAX protease family protein